MRILITGITGFVGHHLSELFIKEGCDVSGTAFSSKDLIFEKARIFKCDIRDADNIKNIVSEVKPQQIYHLSAVSYPPDSLKNPKITYDINFYGTMNLLDAVRDSGLNSKILFVGSADEYGVISESTPAKEDFPLIPLSPYAVSKTAADLLSYSYVKRYGMNIVRVRPFNHTGPGQKSIYVCSDFARQIAEIESGVREPVVYTGNLDIQRDFTDVRDMVLAYKLAIEKGASGEAYNICSERSYSIRWILDTLLKFARLSVEIREDKTKLRSTDITTIRGDCSKFKASTGWKPVIQFEKTLRDLLDYWRCKMQVAECKT
ncbi:MAG: GDP-mannose 4,6-dehydratase [Nitrospinae bacterium]|nr:GDP-mannose 4,6-dehydratase [Nitrospinota bacterium]